MDNNAKKSIHNESVNGQTTSESYNTYSIIRDPKKKYNIRTIILATVISILFLASAFVFFNSLKTVYFSPSHETEAYESKIEKTRSNYQTNDIIKVESVTKDIANVFNIPVGVKIISLKDDPISEGLEINDIIVKISGQVVENIDDLEKAFEQIETDEFISYLIYRNGSYHTITPFDLD